MKEGSDACGSTPLPLVNYEMGGSEADTGYQALTSRPNYQPSYQEKNAIPYDTAPADDNPPMMFPQNGGMNNPKSDYRPEPQGYYLQGNNIPNQEFVFPTTTQHPMHCEKEILMRRSAGGHREMPHMDYRNNFAPNDVSWSSPVIKDISNEQQGKPDAESVPKVKNPPVYKAENCMLNSNMPIPTTKPAGANCISMCL